MVDMKVLMQMVEQAETEVDAAAAAGQTRATEADDEARYERELAQENQMLAEAVLKGGTDPHALPSTGAIAPAGDESGRSCAVCGKGMTVPKVCAKCKAIAYCSRECQKAHWKVHKKSCAQLVQLRQASGAAQLAAPGGRTGLSDADLAAAAAAFAGGSSALRGGTTVATPAESGPPNAKGAPNAFRDCAELFCKDLGLDTGAYENGDLTAAGVPRGEEELEAMLDAELRGSIAEHERATEAAALASEADGSEAKATEQLLATLLAAQQQPQQQGGSKGQQGTGAAAATKKKKKKKKKR